MILSAKNVIDTKLCEVIKESFRNLVLPMQ
jgi:hypothetical protein